MGLDAVNLVMEIEDRFDISIPDVEVEHIRTVGDLCDYLQTRAHAFLDSPCPTASTFYRIRRVFTEDLEIARSQIKPNATLETLLPKATRFRKWQGLYNEFGTAMPQLQWSPIVRFVFACFCLAMVASPIISTIAIPHLATFVLSMIGAITLLIISYRFARPMAVVIPDDAATVDLLSRTLVKSLYLSTERDPAELESWIWDQVCDIVSDELGVDRSKLNRDTRFVEDLGVG